MEAGHRREGILATTGHKGRESGNGPERQVGFHWAGLDSCAHLAAVEWRTRNWIKCPEVGLTLLNLDFEHLGGRDSGNGGLIYEAATRLFPSGLLVKRAQWLPRILDYGLAARLPGCRVRCRLLLGSGARQGPHRASATARGWPAIAGIEFNMSKSESAAAN